MPGEKGRDQSFWEAAGGKDWKIEHRNPGKMDEYRRQRTETELAEVEFQKAWARDSERLVKIYDPKNLERIFKMDFVDAVADIEKSGNREIAEYSAFMETPQGKEAVRRLIQLMFEAKKFAGKNKSESVTQLLEAADDTLDETIGGMRYREIRPYLNQKTEDEPGT